MTALVSAKIYFFSHSFLQCLFLFIPHRKLVEEGSNLRSYRSNTTLTMLPICPHQDCSCCIRRYPYLWYPPNISFFLSFTHHVKELFFFVSLFLFDVANIWKLFLISKFWSNFFLSLRKKRGLLVRVTFSLVFCLTMQRYELFLKYANVILFLTQF